MSEGMFSHVVAHFKTSEAGLGLSKRVAHVCSARAATMRLSLSALLKGLFHITTSV